MNMLTMKWDTLFKLLEVFADIFTITASGIAIYIFIAKRGMISSVFKILMNYSAQLTLAELRGKLERLNDFNASDSVQNEEVVNILNDILGQLRGNKYLAMEFKDLIGKISPYAEGRKKLLEPTKRSIIGELRERLKHVSFEKYGEMAGD